MEAEVEQLKLDTRRKLLETIENKSTDLEALKSDHETEMEPLTKEIDVLQVALDEAVKKRLKMITRQVNEVRSLETELQLSKKQLDLFDRQYGAAGTSSQHSSIFEKDFECPVCYEIMAPPSRIFQCNNGHLICEACKCHTEVSRNIINNKSCLKPKYLDPDLPHLPSAPRPDQSDEEHSDGEARQDLL